MNTYIRNRIRTDAAHLAARARDEQLIVHKGLRGRFRELLVDSMLQPWLPPYAGCATGTIVDNEDRVREATQEDVVIFDRSIVPAVLAHPTAMEGVFPLDGVLARVEVKSRLTRSELEKAVKAAAEIFEMKFCGGESRAGRVWDLPISTIFAYASDLTGDPIDELRRLLSVVKDCGFHHSGVCATLPGPIGALCVVGRGCWGYGGVPGAAPQWLQAHCLAAHDEVVHFVGTLSNSCFDVHAKRLGLDKTASAGGGIGNFVLTHDTYGVAPVQAPSTG